MPSGKNVNNLKSGAKKTLFPPIFCHYLLTFFFEATLTDKQHPTFAPIATASVIKTG